MQKKIAVEARLPLILECRTSGLSDRAWCLKNGINPDTFRWWVTELKKKKYDIPPAGNKTKNMAVECHVFTGNPGISDGTVSICLDFRIQQPAIHRKL